VKQNYLESAPEGSKHIPSTLYAPNQKRSKCFQNEVVDESFHPISYSINEHGFRKTDVQKENFLFVGCSMTFGQGLNEEETWPHLVSKDNGVGCVNLGMPSSAPDMQMLNLAWGIQHYKPSAVFWLISPPSRSTVLLNNCLISHIPPDHDIFGHKKIGVQYNKLRHSLESNYIMHTLWGLYSIFSLVSALNIPMHVSCWDNDFDDMLSEYRLAFKFNRLPDLEFGLDKAADLSHPGPMANKKFAGMIK